MACLRDIKRLFVDRNPFYAGFGNRLTDGLSYRSVEIPSSRIFTIDPYGNVKLELLELAGYTSSYIAMTNLVNETFPPTERSTQPAYNDFNYWRPTFAEIELPDLTPVSPALSARSDSRRSVFRVGAIAGAISKRASRSHLRSPSSSGSLQMAAADSTKSLTNLQRSSSPTPLDAIYHSNEEDEQDEQDEQAGHADRQSSEQTLRGTPDRRDEKVAHKSQPRSRTESMPGSFEDRPFLNSVRDEQDDLEAQPSQADESGRTESDDEDDEEEEEEPEDDLPEMDFGSVPVSENRYHRMLPS